MIKYLDYSIGQVVSEIKTKSAEIKCMTSDPSNSVIATGHSNGTINMWTPNYGSEAVVKMLAHPNTITNICIDRTGNYLTTCGVDKRMRVWDLRNSYTQLFDYYTPSQVQSLTISQKGILAVGVGSVVEMWKDHAKTKQQKPYLKHHFFDKQTYAKSLKFINYEDFLGIGTNMGYSQIVVPGSGEPNFDSYESNPFETKNQKKNSEIHKLLEKIPYSMINLNSEALVNSIDTRSKQVIQQELKNDLKLRAEQSIKKEKKKMRLSNKEKHDEIIKNFDKHQQKRNRLRTLMEKSHEKISKEKKVVSEEIGVLKKLQDDFDPELYLNEDQENEGASAGEYEEDD